jgi:transposase
VGGIKSECRARSARNPQYGETGTKQGFRRRAEPDWAALNRELKKKHVPLQILRDEYIEAHPDGYRYSRFCELYRSWEARLPVTMRQTHLGGDKLFVDYTGDTVPVIVDRRSGKTQPAHIFVAVLGGSSLTFACATWTEKLRKSSPRRAFCFIASAERRLNTESSISLIVPFMPSRSRSLGEAGS